MRYTYFTKAYTRPHAYEGVSTRKQDMGFEDECYGAARKCLSRFSPRLLCVAATAPTTASLPTYDYFTETCAILASLKGFPMQLFEVSWDLSFE